MTVQLGYLHPYNAPCIASTPAAPSAQTTKFGLFKH
jgi:hypothetical protein